MADVGKTIVGGRTDLDRVVLDDMALAGSGLARPGVVLSPEGTAPEARKSRSVQERIERGEINADAGQPLEADVDALFGATKSYHVYRKERFQHRLMLWHKINGLSNKEIALVMGYHPNTVSDITRQPWFQEAFVRLAEEMGKDRVQTVLEGEVLPAIERTVALAKSSESDAVRLAANKEILDRFLGKATVKVESKSTVDVTTTTHDAAALLREQARLNEQLKASGLHGPS